QHQAPRGPWRPLCVQERNRALAERPRLTVSSFEKERSRQEVENNGFCTRLLWICLGDGEGAPAVELGTGVEPFGRGLPAERSQRLHHQAALRSERPLANGERPFEVRARFR